MVCLLAEIFKTSIKYQFVNIDQQHGYQKDYPFSYGFELMYSYLPRNASELQLLPGVFNCSQEYHLLKNHLECNIKRECAGGVDERNECPFTSSLCKGEAVYIKVTKSFLFFDFITRTTRKHEA